MAKLTREDLTLSRTWLLDSNVVAHWLMARSIMPVLADEFHLSDEFVAVCQTRYRSCTDFLRAAERHASQHDFTLAEFSLNELFSALRDEVQTVKMFVEGVPVSRWRYRRGIGDKGLPPAIYKHVYESALRGFDELVDSRVLSVTETTTPGNEPQYLDIYSSLVFLYPALSTQDAVLLTTAVSQLASYFVTDDAYLVRLGKLLAARYQLEVVTPGKATDILAGKRGVR